MKLCVDCKHYLKNPHRSMVVPPLNSGPADICTRNGVPRSVVHGAVSYRDAVSAHDERRPDKYLCGTEARYFEPKSQLTDQTRKGILTRIKGIIWG